MTGPTSELGPIRADAAGQSRFINARRLRLRWRCAGASYVAGATQHQDLCQASDTCVPRARAGNRCKRGAPRPAPAAGLMG